MAIQSTSDATLESDKLAIDGGPPARRRYSPPMYPGAHLIGAEEEASVLEVVRSKRLFRYYGIGDGDSKVAALEEAFAERMGTKHAAAVTSGTAALQCALVGAGVGPGDEVIIPAYTWIASATAVVTSGAVPIIAEVDESLTLCADDVERKISPRTKAIMPVHMRGVTANMDALLAIARRRGLRVIEDVAQALGGSYKGTKLGALGDAGAFSFQYNKLITAGEGGMVTTSDPEIFSRVLMYHDVLGGIRNGVPRADLLPGMNLRMSELAGAVLVAQFARLDGILAAIRTRYRMLEEGIVAAFAQAGATMRPSHDRDGDVGLAMMFQMPDSKRARWVADALIAERVEAGLLYSPDAFDFHVYPQWSSILSKRPWTPEGGPWRWSAPVEYSADMCPRTLDILARTVHIDVNPMLELDEIEETARAVRKVLCAVPTRFG